MLITIQIPDHQQVSLATAAKVMEKIAAALEDIQDEMKLPHDSITYKTDENHIYMSTVGDVLYSIDRVNRKWAE